MNPICKYCKCKLIFEPPLTKAESPDGRGFFYVCTENKDNAHIPMDNLDLVEHIAKLRQLC